MKKVITIFISTIAAISAFGMSAFADTEIKDLSVSEGLVTVSGDTDVSDYLTYEVYTAGEVPTKNNVVGLGDVYNVKNDKFLFMFRVEKSGSFTVRLFDGVSYDTEDFDYVDEIGCLSFVDNVNQMISDEATEKLYEYLADTSNKAVMNTIGLNFEEFNNRPEALKNLTLSTFITNAKGRSLDQKELITLYNEASAVSKMKTDAEKYSEDVLKTMNFAFEGVKFGDISDSGKEKWIITAFAKNVPYKEEELQRAYNTICALYEINKAKVTEFEKCVKKYADDLGITNDEAYQKYIKNPSSTVNRNMVDAMDKASLYTVEEFKNALKKAEESTTGGKGGSSGGGSGGTSLPLINSAAIRPTVNTVQPEQESEPEQEIVEKQIFNDVATNHWAYNAIGALKERNVVAGSGYGMFEPDREVTREEFVTMIVNAFGIQTEGAKSSFYDVFTDDWFYPYVSAAYENGIVGGYSNGLFGVYAKISRQEAVAIAARAMEKQGKDLPTIREYAEFDDENQISDYAKPSVQKLYCAGKINGFNGLMAPNKSCTRAEAAVIIFGLIQ